MKTAGVCPELFACSTCSWSRSLIVAMGVLLEFA